MKWEPGGSEEIIVRLDDGREKCLPMSLFTPYWLNANSAEVENIWVDITQLYIMGIIRVASGQGGIIFVWDTVEERIVHLTEGAFAVRAAVHQGKVYTIRYVWHWGVAAYLMAEVVDFGGIDSRLEGTTIPLDFPLSDEVEPQEDPSLGLDVNGNEIYAFYGRLRKKLN